MQVSDFDYNLPLELIAQEPVRPRDHSRLMVLGRQDKKIVHRHFYELGEFLRPGDVLVLNKSKVIPARLYATKPTGGRLEVLLIKQVASDKWQALVGGLKSKREDNEMIFAKGLEGRTKKFLGQGLWEIGFNLAGEKLTEMIYKLGEAPVPPYIKKKSNLKVYQTVFAETPGSAAAPTAGFHFTKQLLKRLNRKGVQLEYVTLHVGLGTFLPVKEEAVEGHKMHAERAGIDAGTAKRLNAAKKEGRRIIAVGTTSCRTLESFCRRGKLQSGAKETDIFIYPGYKFEFIDALITNFHLPKSTLLLLVSALAGRDFIMKAYCEAIRRKYRFYSFGDAMFIT